MFDTDEQRSVADRRADATRDAIVDAAWSLSHRDGLTGWSLRQLATEVGLAAPTLYAYVDSKHAIYDLMFQRAYEELERVADTRPPTAGARRSDFKRTMRAWFEFCTADPTRFQLMYHRTIPDFEPSEEAYAASLASYEQFRRALADLGVADQAHLDLWTAIANGLTSQQLSNDPGGTRWADLMDAAVDMFCDHVGVPADTSIPDRKEAS